MRRPQRRWARIAVVTVLGIVAAFALAQAVPYGRNHSNPRVTKEPAWDSRQTRALAARACFDCHSNVTRWPWYTNVAPVSWLSQHDVDAGRSSLNFSEWDQPQDVSVGDVVEAVNGGMPPWFYTLLHPSAGLSKAEKQELAAGLARTFQGSPPPGGGGG